MINGLQIITKLPLFNVGFPDMAFKMEESLISIANFDVMPSDDLYETTLQPPEAE